MPMNLLRRLIPALLLTVNPVPAAHAGQSIAANTPLASRQVRIDNFTFTPAEVTVSAGTPVTWINGDDIPHAVAATNHAFRSKVMDTEQQYTFTFTQPGTYEYFCALHPHMLGKIIVK